jgi:segregation and condensation protein A
MAIEVRLENFTGPLDLLLHLIKSHEMDIYDIRIVEITEQYLQIIDQMKQLDLDVAGEFLLVAATLIHIKSRMLLPAGGNSEEEDEDPRAELVRRLLEYQRYKEAAELFQQLPQLKRDVFTSNIQLSTLLEGEDQEDEVVIGVYQLADAFHRLLKDKPPEIFHEVIHEKLSVADFIDQIGKKLLHKKRLAFSEIFSLKQTRKELIVTFLAVLELVKLHIVKIDQIDDFTEIWLTLIASAEQISQLTPEQELQVYG